MWAAGRKIGSGGTPGGGISYGAEVDLTEAITAAVAGGLASDPDVEEGSLVVATTTGLFDGLTVPCNSFAWTAAASENDGYNESMRADISTIIDMFPDYVEFETGLEIRADLIAFGSGTADNQPGAIVVVDNGSIQCGAGWILGAADQAFAMHYLTFSGLQRTATITTTEGDQLSIGRFFPRPGIWGPYHHASVPREGAGSSNLRMTPTNGRMGPTSDLQLNLLNGAAVGGAHSGLKIRFTARPFTGLVLGAENLGA